MGAELQKRPRETYKFPTPPWKPISVRIVGVQAFVDRTLGLARRVRLAAPIVHAACARVELRLVEAVAVSPVG